MFKYFISLGGACDVASGLQKYFLRSHSGPFDWLVSPLEGVMDCIDNQFADFLVRENLDVMPENKRHFRDSKYGFIYLHEVKCDLNEEYCAIKEKYGRRIENFKKMIMEPTCFIRRIRNVEEIKYIVQNKEYIERVLEIGNGHNELIFIIAGYAGKVFRRIKGICRQTME